MTRRFRDILIVSSRWLAAVVAVGGLAADGVARGDDGTSAIKVETFRTHSRLSVRVDDGIASDWKATRDGFELVLKGMSLGDLGAPLGEEAIWAARYKELRDPRLAGVEFAEVPGGVRVQGRWRFSQASDAPADPAMEAFDYRERGRSRLVVDFWVKEGPTVGQVRTQAAATRRIASVKQHEDDEKARISRRIAREQARLVAEDPKLFCGTPLSERTDVFLQFLPVHEPATFAKWFSTSAPDADFPYYEPKGKERDAQFVRLALKLYREGNHALANRTIEFFETECKDSTYRAQMRFLRANALLKLGMKDEAEQMLREMARETKGTPVGMHAGMYLAMHQFTAKNYLGALEQFKALSERQAESRMAWVFHLGVAECARALRQTDRAAQEYTWVAENAPDAAAQAEGALRIGDLYLDRFQYDQALASYAQALRSFPEQAKRFPAVHINRADALHGLGQYDRASQAYAEFLKAYPAHPSGWRASYRRGEIAARAAGATRESKAARDSYLETINRYPFSPGATLARLQLLPCSDHGGFSVEAAERFFLVPTAPVPAPKVGQLGKDGKKIDEKTAADAIAAAAAVAASSGGPGSAGEAERFDGGGEVFMDRYRDFRALSRVRTLMTMGQQEKAVAVAIEELRRVPRAEARRWLGQLLSFNFRRSVVELLEGGQKLAALTFFQKNTDRVPLSEGAVDPGYLLRLSQAASDLGLGKLAQEIGTVYEKARKAHEGVTRELASADGSDDARSSDPDVKLAAAERAFTEAKARWIAEGAKSSDAVRARLGQVAPESKFSFEREVILGLIDERAGSDVAALRHAAQAQLLFPPGLSDADRLRVDAWVAELQMRAGDAKAALAGYFAVEKAISAEGSAGKAARASGGVTSLLGVAAVPARDALIRAQSEILEKQARWGEAAANYSRAVGNGLGGAEARYGYARALLKAGGAENHEKAIATLEVLSREHDADGAPSAPGEGKKTAAAPAKPTENDRFWRKLASETLADEKAKHDAKEGMRQ